MGYALARRSTWQRQGHRRDDHGPYCSCYPSATRLPRFRQALRLFDDGRRHLWSPASVTPCPGTRCPGPRPILDRRLPVVAAVQFVYHIHPLHDMAECRNTPCGSRLPLLSRRLIKNCVDRVFGTGRLGKGKIAALIPHDYFLIHDISVAPLCADLRILRAFRTELRNLARRERT